MWKEGSIEGIGIGIMQDLEVGRKARRQVGSVIRQGMRMRRIAADVLSSIGLRELHIAKSQSLRRSKGSGCTGVDGGEINLISPTTRLRKVVCSVYAQV